MDGTPHTRQHFDAAIQQLEHDVLEMGSRAESMFVSSVDALTRLDPELALAVIQRDDEIDALDLDIENRCIRLLALQQPMASDLRVIGTAMKVITDIERIGDLAVDISKIALKIEKELGDATFIDLPRMANVARLMFREALEAFVRRDMDMVRRVCAQDDEVDDLYRELRRQIHENMVAEPEGVVSASWLLLAIHHVERIADHSVNIAERVGFMVTGRLEQIGGKDGRG